MCPSVFPSGFGFPKLDVAFAEPSATRMVRLARIRLFIAVTSGARRDLRRDLFANSRLVG
jgi:hypothetical protein